METGAKGNSQFFSMGISLRLQTKCHKITLIHNFHTSHQFCCRGRIMIERVADAGRGTLHIGQVPALSKNSPVLFREVVSRVHSFLASSLSRGKEGLSSPTTPDTQKLVRSFQALCLSQSPSPSIGRRLHREPPAPAKLPSCLESADGVGDSRGQSWSLPCSTSFRGAPKLGPWRGDLY